MIFEFVNERQKMREERKDLQIVDAEEMSQVSEGKREVAEEGAEAGEVVHRESEERKVMEEQNKC